MPKFKVLLSRRYIWPISYGRLAACRFLLTYIELVVLQYAARTTETSTRVATDIGAWDHINTAVGRGPTTKTSIHVA